MNEDEHYMQPAYQHYDAKYAPQTWDGNIKALCSTVNLGSAKMMAIMVMVRDGKTTWAEEINIIRRIIIIIDDEELHRFITTSEMVGITIDSYVQIYIRIYNTIHTYFVR